MTLSKILYWIPDSLDKRSISLSIGLPSKPIQVRISNELPIEYWLVVSTPLKNMKVSWDYSSQYMEK